MRASVHSVEQARIIEQAHGELRDAFTQLRNFDQLLRSVRVSPKAIASALDDIRATCEPISRFSSRFLEAIDVCLGRGSSGNLGELIQKRTEELEEHLREKSQMNAARRLRLEEAFSRAVTDLDSALVLIELFREATKEVSPSLDLYEILAQPRLGDPSLLGAARHARASVRVEGEGFETSTNPRASVLLLLLSAAFVTRGEKDKGCTLTLTRTAEGRVSIRVEHTPGLAPTRPCEILLPRLLEASAISASSSARALGVELDWQPKRARLVWPS